MLSKEDRDDIISIIKLTVNGKIDKLHDKVDGQQDQLNSFIQKLEPVIDAVSWINTSKRAVTWMGGVAASVAAIFALNNYLK